MFGRCYGRVWCCDDLSFHGMNDDELWETLCAVYEVRLGTQTMVLPIFLREEVIDFLSVVPPPSGSKERWSVRRC